MQRVSIEIGGRQPPTVSIHGVTVIRAKSHGDVSWLVLGGADEQSVTVFVDVPNAAARCAAAAEAFRSGEFGAMPGETALAMIADLAALLRERMNGRAGPASPAELAALEAAFRMVNRLGGAAPAAAAE